MIKHIVMFKLKDASDKVTQTAHLKSELEKLKSTIPEIIDYEVGINISTGSSAFDLVLISSFEDEAALERYRVHPVHQKVVEYINEITSDRRVVDYVV